MNQTGPVGDAAAAKRGIDWHQTTHQLNNVFASIYSNLDLAIAKAGQPDAHRFVLEAQKSARKGAQLVAELRQRAAAAEALPSGTASSSNGTTSEAAEGVATAATGLEGSERILIVEKNDSLVLLLRALLGYRGYQLTVAADGKAALEQCRSQAPFKLVILDVDEPATGGADTLRGIRALNPGLPALALRTRSPEPSGVEAGSEFDRVLDKPLDKAGLLEAIRALLNGKSARV